MAPHGPAGGYWRRVRSALSVRGRVFGEGGDPVGPGEFQGGVDLGELASSRFRSGSRVGDHGVTAVLVLG